MQHFLRKSARICVFFCTSKTAKAEIRLGEGGRGVLRLIHVDLGCPCLLHSFTRLHFKGVVRKKNRCLPKLCARRWKMSRRSAWNVTCCQLCSLPRRTLCSLPCSSLLARMW